ncbi:hypothetical protein NDU88_005796 [Pleurodeles waltl]|uniref:Uncharacterized protein n=1 Tax=Pleurodeles waltl TaxID=8319 RepID=A0AAV7MXC5_PLEWA|nr:hypothetical protein NDU88_005796 [Pleurodeles waltl]
MAQRPLSSHLCSPILAYDPNPNEDGVPANVQLNPQIEHMGAPEEDASNWRWPRSAHRDEDCFPRSHDDDEADTFPENPDIQVSSGTKKEDGLHTVGEEKDAEEPGSVENDRKKKTDDNRRTGNHGVHSEAADPRRKGRNGDTPKDRNAPGGTWLTKDAFNWRWPRGVHRDEDGFPRSHDDDEADTFPENPDMTVSSGTKKEDGLHTVGEEKDA